MTIIWKNAKTNPPELKQPVLGICRYSLNEKMFFRRIVCFVYEIVINEQGTTYKWCDTNYDDLSIVLWALLPEIPENIETLIA